MRKVLVTGGTGFVGGWVCARLVADGVAVRGTLLKTEQREQLVAGVEPVVVEPLGPTTCWQHALEGVDTVIHLAARVHVMDERAADPLSIFLEVNRDGTERLAREAVAAGVARLVFVSSIKVNGEESDNPYHAGSPYSPQDPYAISKMEAELALRQVADETGLEIVVIRPPLVYGPGVRANFFRMLQVVQRGIPLPLGAITNRRSLIYVGNLVDALALCAWHPEAAGRSYAISDGVDFSTPELIRALASALRVRANLLSVPAILLQTVAACTGKEAAWRRLSGSLTIDSSLIRLELGWHPPFSPQEGFSATATWFERGGL